MANNVDPDEMQHSAESHLGLHRFIFPDCPNTYGKYGNYNRQSSSILISLQLIILLCIICKVYTMFKYSNRLVCVNSIDPDQMPHNVASDQGLYC